MNIDITKKAKEELKKMIKDSDKGARISIMGQKCSGGVTLGISPDKEKEEDDIFDIDGIKIIVNKTVEEIAGDVTIDYEEDGLMMGFSVKQK